MSTDLAERVQAWVNPSEVDNAVVVQIDTFELTYQYPGTKVRVYLNDGALYHGDTEVDNGADVTPEMVETVRHILGTIEGKVFWGDREAIILTDGGAISVDADGDTSSADVGEWSTGFDA